MNIFISRDLAPASIFKNRLEAAGMGVVGQSLVEITPIPFWEYPASEWCFFASANGVKCFYHSILQKKLSLPASRIAALGPGTGAVLADFKILADFTGSGEPAESMKVFLERFKPQRLERILFPGARQSRYSLAEHLKPFFECIPFPVYENRMVDEPEERNEDILVFTSSLNARAYFSNYSIKPGQRVAAIGEPTRRTLESLGITPVFTPAAPSEAALADLVLSL